MFDFVLNNIPAPRSVRDWLETETTILKIATLMNEPSYDRLVSACREVVSHYLLPAQVTLERLYVDLASNNMTEINRDFQREYCVKMQEE